MERRLSIFLMTALLACTFGSGCALFGGDDEEDMGSSSGSGFDGGSDSLGSGSGMRSDDMLSTGQAVAELETVYFDFDRYAIRDDQRPTMRSNAEAIMSKDWQTVVIEGHADERGSEEYNLALGERRANAAKQYLVDSGVPSSKLDTVSFGEAKPAVAGHDESAWRWNRRAEFRVLR